MLLASPVPSGGATARGVCCIAGPTFAPMIPRLGGRRQSAAPVRQWVSHSLPPRRLGYSSDPVSQRVGKLAPPQVALPKALDVGRGVRQLPRTAVLGVWIDKGDAKAQVVPNIPHRSRKVGVIGHDDRLLVLPVEPIDQETSGEVHVRPLLLRVPHQDVRRQPRRRLSQRAALDAGPKHAVVRVEARQRRQGSQIRLLPLALRGIPRTGVEPRGEVGNPVDRVLGKERLGQPPEVQPPVGRVLQGAVVEIESVDVEVGDQSLLPYKDRDRPGGRSRPYRRRDRGDSRDVPRETAAVNARYR